mmetsp:Transcript_57340/g.173363  ORF Transcript_57340/g.173363 Transcript_57340/m.173363 type:complete len:89 (+) Transcript_57340:1719-1985(+)
MALGKAKAPAPKAAAVMFTMLLRIEPGLKALRRDSPSKPSAWVARAGCANVLELAPPAPDVCGNRGLEGAEGVRLSWLQRRIGTRLGT